MPKAATAAAAVDNVHGMNVFIVVFCRVDSELLSGQTKRKIDKRGWSYMVAGISSMSSSKAESDHLKKRRASDGAAVPHLSASTIIGLSRRRREVSRLNAATL